MILRVLAFVAALASANAAAVTLPDGPITADASRKAADASAGARVPVRVDVAALLGSSHETPVMLPSREGPAMSARTIRVVDHGAAGTSWTGQVATTNGPQGAVITFGADGVVFGWLPQRDGLPLRLEPRPDGAWLVVDAVRSGRGLGADARALPPSAVASKASAGPVPRMQVAGLGDVPVVDVLVAYTPGLATIWGGDEVVHTRIAFLEALSNQVYIDSEAALQVRVTGHLRVDESLPYTNDGVLDLISEPSVSPVKSAIDAARAAAGADIVVMLLDGASWRGSCGVAWLNGVPSFDRDYSFAVVNDRGQRREDDCWETTFPHELGHLLGAHHDTVTSGGAHGVHVYARGHRADVVGRRGFATVMAYPTPIQDYVARLSNPRQATCLGLACGIAATADNARSHSETAATVAAMTAPVSPLPTGWLEIADVEVVEAHGAEVAARLTVSRSGDTSRPASFALRALPGSASPGSDYVPPSGRIEFPAGATQAVASVAIVGDRIPEREEHFHVVLTAVEGARVLDPVARVTILDDDAGVFVDDLEVVEGQGGPRAVHVRAGVTRGAPGPVSFRLRSVRDPGEIHAAEPGTDYVALDRVVTLAADQASVEVPLQVIGDIDAEENEVITLLVSDVVGAGILDAEARVTLVNDDALFTFADSRLDVIEGSGGSSTWVSVLVRRTGVQGVDTTLGFVVESETGTVGTDVRPASGTFSVHRYGGSFSIEVVGDDIDEANETVRIRLVSDRWQVDQRALVLSIADDDGGPPVLSIVEETVTIDEGDDWRDHGSGTFTLDLSGAAPEGVRADIAIVHGTTSDDDLWTSTTSVWMPPGWTRYAFTIESRGDRDVEPDETFRVELRNVVGATAGRGANGVIRNDDHDRPMATLSEAAGYEGAAGHGHVLRFRLAFDRPALAGSTGRVRIEPVSGSGGAIPGVDVVASVPFPAIAAGQTEAWIEVPIIGDDEIEYDESFVLSVHDTVGFSVTGAVIGTIRNDDERFMPIGGIQGAGTHSPFHFQNVGTEGVVVAAAEDGCIVQSEGDGDADPETSDAIRVVAWPAIDCVVGDRWRVSGMVFEDPMQANPGTRIAGPAQRLAAGVPLPAAAVLDGDILHPAALPGSLERYEYMRVAVPDAQVVGPGGLGGIDSWGRGDPRSQDIGRFAVVSRAARPLREAGLAPGVGIAMPAGAEPQRWDGSPERLDVRAAIGGEPVPGAPVDAGDRFTVLTGVLMPDQDRFRLVPEVGTAPARSHLIVDAAAAAAPGQASVAWLDAGGLFDAIDDPGLEPVPGVTDVAVRLAKLARLGCATLRHPDVLLVNGVEHAAMLAELADAMDTAAAAMPGQCDASPGYVPVMPAREGSMASPQIGILVRTDVVSGAPRVQLDEVALVAAAESFPTPMGIQPLFERPPLLVRVRIADGGGGRAASLLAVALHDGRDAGSTMPAAGWDTVGEYVRRQRAAQAVRLGQWIEQRQLAKPEELLLVLGDFSAIDGADGLVDVLGIVAGDALPSSRVHTWQASPVSRPLQVVDRALPADTRYDTVVDGDAVALSHVLASRSFADAGIPLWVRYLHANADFAGDHADDPATPFRAAIRDPMLLRIGDPAVASPDLSVWFVGGHLGGGAPDKLIGHVENRGQGPALSPSIRLEVAIAGAKMVLPADWRCVSTGGTTRTTIDCLRSEPLAPGERVTLVLPGAARGITVRLQAGSAGTDARPGDESTTIGW